jgi:hypothetical protein
LSSASLFLCLLLGFTGEERNWTGLGKDGKERKIL